MKIEAVARCATTPVDACGASRGLASQRSGPSALKSPGHTLEATETNGDLYFQNRILAATLTRILRSAQTTIAPALLCCAASFSLAPAAQAGPFLYTNSFGVSGSQSECLDGSRKALLKVSIRPGDITSMTYNDDNGKEIQNGWTADHPTENVAIAFECDARNGMGSLAVAGPNNDATFRIYQEIWNVWMK